MNNSKATIFMWLLLVLYTAEKIAPPWQNSPEFSDISTAESGEVSFSTDCLHICYTPPGMSKLTQKTNPNQPSRTFSSDYSAVCGHMGELCTCHYGWVLWAHTGISDLGLLFPPGDSLFFLVPTALSLVYWLICPHKIFLIPSQWLGANFSTNRRNQLGLVVKTYTCVVCFTGAL